MGRVAVRRDTLQLAERAIMLVRRRRSAKAVETFEQVKFLVDYVGFLRNRGRARGKLEEGLEGPGTSLVLPAREITDDHAIQTTTVGSDWGETTVDSVMDSDIRTWAQGLFSDT